ncbi:unnamed protein product, partial [marine sediment metagenome]
AVKVFQRTDEQLKSTYSRVFNSFGTIMKTDSQLQQDVCAELKWEPSINATQIGVQVKDGIVTLAGEVNSYSEKVDAEIAAQRVEGVKGLATAINVKVHGKNQRRDADIAHAAEHVLSWSNYVQPDVVKVAVEKGWVTLSGQVRWDFERRGAVAVIRHLKGVVGVIDQITIKDKVSSKLVKDDIEAALKRRAKKEGSDITVDVSGTNVTLTGTVHSWSERDLVNYAAK